MSAYDIADETRTMDPESKRLYLEKLVYETGKRLEKPCPPMGRFMDDEITQFVPTPPELEKSVAFVSKNLFEHLKKNASDSMLYLCPKCQKKSHYDPKEFHGLCPACWAGMSGAARARLNGKWYTVCEGEECDLCSTDRDEWKETNGYCKTCWLNLTPEQRAILKGNEPLPPQETRIVHLPAVPSLWKVFGVSVLSTILALAAFVSVGYYLVWHIR